MKRREVDDVFAGLDKHMRNDIMPEGRGFTQAEFMKRYNLTLYRAKKEIPRLISEGKLKHIGSRPGQGGEKVYEVVRK